MKKRVSKTNQKIYDNQMALVKPIFEKYFAEYYANNRQIKNYSFYTMEDMMGYSVVFEYDNFRQYINYYIGQGVFGENIVNSCFEFSSDGEKFLCHFVDILNVIDSDDLSFYTFVNCLVEKDIENAIDSIVKATEKYYSSVNSVAQSQKLIKKIYEFYRFEEYDDSLAKVEEAVDGDYVVYGMDKPYDELLKELSRDFRKGRLDDGFAERAYRVLSGLSRQEIKKAQKNKEYKSKASTSSKIIIAIPYVLFAVVFAILCAVAFCYIDKQVYSECVARSNALSTFVGAFLGGVAGVCIFSLFPPEVYKLLAKGEKYDEIEQVLYASAANSVWGYVIVIGGWFAMWAFFICVFSFNGVGFTDDSIVYKEYGLSQKEVYSFENIEICEIKTTYNDGDYVEYDGIAYAFKFGDEWYDFGVPNDDELQIIQNNVEKYNIEIGKAYSVGDIGKEKGK